MLYKKLSKKELKENKLGIEIDCEPLKGPNTTFWKISKDNNGNW